MYQTIKHYIIFTGYKNYIYNLLKALHPPYILTREDNYV